MQSDHEMLSMLTMITWYTEMKISFVEIFLQNVLPMGIDFHAWNCNQQVESNLNIHLKQYLKEYFASVTSLFLMIPLAASLYLSLKVQLRH